MNNTNQQTRRPAIKIENLSMPRCNYGFRSGFAFAKCNGVLKKIHTSEPAETCPDKHESEIRARFENGEGEIA